MPAARSITGITDQWCNAAAVFALRRASKLLGASRALMYASSHISRMSGAPMVFYDWLALQWKWRVVHRLNLFLDFCQAFYTAVGQPSPRFRT